MEEKCSGFTCPVEATIQLIGGKYKAIILASDASDTALQ